MKEIFLVCVVIMTAKITVISWNRFVPGVCELQLSRSIAAANEHLRDVLEPDSHTFAQ